jgi:hypothetical protein
MKLFTLDNRVILRKVGDLSNDDRRAVAQALSRLLRQSTIKKSP